MTLAPHIRSKVLDVFIGREQVLDRFDPKRVGDRSVCCNR